jgi:hypothetical protein
VCIVAKDSFNAQSGERLPDADALVLAHATASCQTEAAATTLRRMSPLIGVGWFGLRRRTAQHPEGSAIITETPPFLPARLPDDALPNLGRAAARNDRTAAQALAGMSRETASRACRTTHRTRERRQRRGCRIGRRRHGIQSYGYTVIAPRAAAERLTRGAAASNDDLRALAQTAAQRHRL